MALSSPISDSVLGTGPRIVAPVARLRQEDSLRFGPGFLRGIKNLVRKRPRVSGLEYCCGPAMRNAWLRGGQVSKNPAYRTDCHNGCMIRGPRVCIEIELIADDLGSRWGDVVSRKYLVEPLSQVKVWVI
jgi:hypothetical protein